MELQCDATGVEFGAILLQKNDGKMHAIFYYSKRTSDSDSKYHSFKLEALATLCVFKRFRLSR